jgi:hypothetical protein
MKPITLARWAVRALRWAAASDQQAEQMEQAQEELAQGPCIDAFWQRAPVPVRDVTWGAEIRSCSSSVLVNKTAEQVTPTYLPGRQITTGRTTRRHRQRVSQAPWPRGAYRCTTGQVGVRVTPLMAWIRDTTSWPRASMLRASARTIT